jgi:AcrR family transcriptional regulator
VRVEVLAQMLGVTKGGFYRRFRDRPALLAAMLDTWAEGRMPRSASRRNWAA